jgi:hypothetical protein
MILSLHLVHQLTVGNFTLDSDCKVSPRVVERHRVRYIQMNSKNNKMIYQNLVEFEFEILLLLEKQP